MYTVLSIDGFSVMHPTLATRIYDGQKHHILPDNQPRRGPSKLVFLTGDPPKKKPPLGTLLIDPDNPDFHNSSPHNIVRVFQDTHPKANLVEIIKHPANNGEVARSANFLRGFGFEVITTSEQGQSVLREYWLNVLESMAQFAVNHGAATVSYNVSHIFGQYNPLHGVHDLGPQFVLGLTTKKKHPWTTRYCQTILERKTNNPFPDVHLQSSTTEIPAISITVRKAVVQGAAQIERRYQVRSNLAYSAIGAK